MQSFCHLPRFPRFATILVDCVQGLKFTNRDMYLFERLIDLAPTILGRRLNMISGPDECHLAAMAVGADAAIGTLCKCPGWVPIFFIFYFFLLFFFFLSCAQPRSFWYAGNLNRGV